MGRPLQACITLALAALTLAVTPSACGGAGRAPSPPSPSASASAARMPPTQWFDYDPAATPLDVRFERVERRADATLQDLTYASPKGGRVPAYLVLPPPTANPPYAVAVFVHWANGDRSELLPDALALAGAGVISLLPDAPFARPAPWYRAMSGPEARLVYIQTVVDVRRGLDLLLGRPDVDPKRVALVGHSFGAQVIGIVAGVDRRASRFVVMAGVPSLSDVLRHGTAPELVFARENTPPELFDAYVGEIAPFDAKNFLGAAPEGTWLLQHGRYDVTAPPMLGRTYAAYIPGGTKEIKVYDAGHALNDPRAFEDRIAWLRRALAGS